MEDLKFDKEVFSIRTARPMSKLSMNRIKGGIAVGYTLSRDRPELIAGGKLFVT